MKGLVTERLDAAAPSAAPRATIVSARLKFIALGLSSLLLAPVANAQGSGSLAHHHRVSQPGSRDFATAVVSMTAGDGSFLPGTEPGGTGLPMARVALDSSSAGLRMGPSPELALQAWEARLAVPEAVTPAYRTPDLLSVHFRHPTGEFFVALGVASRGAQATDQLLATFGFRNLSLRVNSWRSVGRGPSVNARALALVRRVSLLRDGAEISLGGGVTMYRLGSRFDLSYRRRPVSIQVLFRIRFGSHADGQTASAGHAKGL